MNKDIRRLTANIARYKKAIIVGGIALLAVMGLFIFGALVLVYKTAAFASEKVKVWSTEEVLPKVTLPESGFVEGVALSVASGWLQHGVASAEVRAIKDGLYCFDAIGGPSPVEIITYVKERTSDQNMLLQLNSLKEKLLASVPPANGPAACVSWIVSS